MGGRYNVGMTTKQRQEYAGHPSLQGAKGGETPKVYLRVPIEWRIAADRVGKSLSAWLRDLANKAAKRAGK